MSTKTIATPDATHLEDGDYFQCDLQQGDMKTVGWIEARGAKQGASVEIKGEDGLWRVTAVYQPPRNIAWLREKQRKDRGALPSITGR